MSNEILTSIADLARLRRIDLRPDWADSAKAVSRTDGEALDAYCEAIGWAPAIPYADDPRAHEFPLLAYHPEYGWGVVERIGEGNTLLAVQHGISTSWNHAGQAELYDLVIPLPAGKQTFDRAIDVFFAAIKRRKSAIYIAVLATFVVNFIALITSLYTMQVYDRVVPRGAFSTLWVLSAGTLVAIAFDYVLRVVRANMLEREAVEIDTEVSEFFFSRSADVRLDARPPGIGTMAAQLRSLEQVRQMLSSSAIFAMADLPFALLFIFVIAQLGGALALVLCIAFPIAIGLALLFARLIRRDTERAQVTGNKKNGLLVESLDAAETIKANRGQWYMLSRWNTLLDELHDSELPTKKLQAQAGTIFSSLQQVAYIALIAWGAVRIFNNEMSMGALIACSILAGRVNGPLISQLPGLLVQWSYSRSSLKMLDAILALPPDRPVGMDQLRPNRIDAQITVKDLKFGYPGGRAGVSVPSLEIAAGERIGIIGGVGSGKSTLLMVLSGLYAPQEGQVLISKLDMSQVADDVLRENIGYLPQDYRLVNGTLRENLLLGLPDPGDDRIMEVAQQTGLAKLITSSERGLDLFINEGGRGLSGGQRVLTGLTRLLLAKPKLLLLDEPTANLDVDTEALVLRAITEKLEADTTLILVTHKLQLANLTTRLMIVANGQIAIDGPTAEVLKQLQSPPQQPSAAMQPPKTGITTTIGARTQ